MTKWNLMNFRTDTNLKELNNAADEFPTAAFVRIVRG